MLFLWGFVGYFAYPGPWMVLPVYSSLTFLVSLIWNRKRALRLVFETAFAIACCQWVWLYYSGHQASPLWLALVIFSIFMGSLLATAVSPGLSEDNFPPGDEIKREVLELHLRKFAGVVAISPGKRLFDILLAFTGLVISSPVWILIALFIWLEDPGPIVFVKNSVGKGGKNFRQYKFRSMVHNAERETGPVLAQENDNRVLRIGSLLRKTAMDELPQLINILKGEMSFVGPRPQRTILVHGFLKEIPEYAERHQVPPGIAGLAQVVGTYYSAPRQKLRLDRLYVKYASLGFDVKLIAIAFLLVFYLRWTRDWNGRVPRKWLRFGSPAAQSGGAGHS